MRKSLLAAALAVAAVSAAVVAPVAHAAPTNVTFTVVGGGISITADTSKALTVTGLSASGAIAVQVSDQRRVIGTWVATAVSTAFDKAVAPVASIPATAVSYVPSSAVTTGVPAPVVAPTPMLSMALPLPVQSATVLGPNTASWDGTVTVALPQAVQAGSYAGIVTHSLI